jgi:DNA-binding CsgD family transcriptional regulator
MSGERAPTVLLGRSEEQGALDRLLDAARDGRSSTLVIRGEAGVGKSALLQYLEERAADCRILHAIGVEAEMELAYAGLHQLCSPLVNRLERLPAPQHDALATAFGLQAGDAPDRFLVSLAVLSLLGDVAEEQALICMLDDAQWLDRASAQALAFVARRLQAESIGLVFGLRRPSRDDVLNGLPELEVGGLGYDDSRVLLESVIAGPLDERIRDRIIAETAGNPLALLELPRGRSPAELAGGFGLADASPLSARIEQTYARRVERMPEGTRRLLLTAAAEPIGDPILLFEAADRMGLNGHEALSDADELITVDDRVRFRHPLVRSTVYRQASAAERRRVHAALAESISPGDDQDRRAWHRAHAVAGPDESVATELEASADRAQARGGKAAAAAFLERAVALTPDPERRAQRGLAAARAARFAGAADAASALVAAARRGPLNELADAEAQLLEAQIAFTSRRDRDAASLLAAAAQRLGPLDAGMSRAAQLEAIWTACFALHLASPSGPVEISAAARACPSATGTPSPYDLMLDGLTRRFVEGFPAGAPTLQRALSEFTRIEQHRLTDTIWVWLAVELWDADAWLELGSRQLQAARDAGALIELPLVLHTIAEWHVRAGDLAVAGTMLAEADSIMAATGDAPMSHARLRLAALQGGDAEALIDASIRDGAERGEGILVRHAEEAAATLYAGLGRYHDALAWARREVEHNPHAFYMTALPELVEAAVRCDEPDEARRALDALCEKTQASSTAWARGVEARSRALVTEGDEADALYREAISLLAESRFGVESARARLLYGEWLRRHSRRVDAREQLRAAHEAFATMGAGPFAERAERELKATGETVRKRADDTRNDLTPQEAQIARLASERFSNPEIAAQLYLSPRTVEYHLHKVFQKLGISSRRELAAALPASRKVLIPA